MIHHDVLIVGAGLCGLKAAGELHQAKRRVLVLDKGRGVGGRAATRRWDGVPVDHGAQFFTVRTSAFWAQTMRWMAHGICFRWAEGFHQWDQEHGLRAPDPEKDSHPRFACREGMTALCKRLSDLVPPDRVRLDTTVTAIRLVDDEWGRHWRAEVAGAGDTGTLTAKNLVLTLPTPQSLALLERSELLDQLDPEALAELDRVEYAPTLALLLRGQAPRPEWKGIQLKDPTLSWIGYDSDKRDTEADGDQKVFVLHGSAEFSREWQDGDLEEAARRLTARAGDIVGDWITRLPEHQMHRWRYASVPHGFDETVAGVRLSRPGEPALFLAGDAFLNAKVEGAYLSGGEVAKVILSEKKMDPSQPRKFIWPPPPPARGTQPGLYPPERRFEQIAGD